MKLYLLLALVLFSNFVSAQCQYIGDHKLVIEVKSCLVNDIVAVKGISLNAKVIKSQFILASHASERPKDVFLLQEGIHYDFFIPTSINKVCENIFNKQVNAQSIFRCCDTLPAEGLCLIPNHLIEIKLSQ